MARARFSIGIDLGTTNSVLAYAPLVGEAQTEVLPVQQWEGLRQLAEAPMLPSFLYLPEEAVAMQLGGRATGDGQWIVGRLARNRAGEMPGRVAHSAKSWLGHHAADRLAPFLPWGSSDLKGEQKISPVRASALILNTLRGAWDGRFAEAGFDFDDQEITITVPASFDAAAQRLTLAAAELAGFPEGVRLLEEPQAAFYCWLARHDAARDIFQLRGDPAAGKLQVLVIDVGGGTSDFSLFELRMNAANMIPEIRRVAVSEHILLGGDNIDLAIAHLLEPRLASKQGDLIGAQWDHLVACCRELKEKVLSDAGPMDERFAVALPGRGSEMLAGARAATVSRAEIEGVLLDGFFPVCDAAARPHRIRAALYEWGLPYAADSAVTRHLADFLHDLPRIDAVLFNGGSLHPAPLRDRLREQIAGWQDSTAPLVLENAELELAVARGAAQFGALLCRQAGRIAAGAAHAIFLEVHGMPTMGDAAAHPSLVCVLPRGAMPEQSFKISETALDVRTDQMVQFQAWSSSRHGRCRPGDILPWRAGDFHALPPLQTIIKTTGPSEPDRGVVPVHLVARINALGLLQVACVSTDPAMPRSSPLEFNLRPHEQIGVAMKGAAGPPEVTAPIEPNAAAEALAAARRLLGNVFTGPSGKGGRLLAGALFRNFEHILGAPRAGWNAPLLRALWPAVDETLDGRRLSVEHEETWLTLAGFLLRPGFGVAGDEQRIDRLWRIHETGSCFPGRRIRLQEYLLWRRVAGGLSRERQDKLLTEELDRLRSGNAPGELVRLAGSLELLAHETKAELVEGFIGAAVRLARSKQHCAPYLAALGRLLSRAPLRAGPETVISPGWVEQAYTAFRDFDWAEPELRELQTLFLRAARVVGDRSLDVPQKLREQIAAKLETSGIPPLRTAKLRAFIPLGRADRASLYDESLPPGLVFGHFHVGDPRTERTARGGLTG
jgi:molecular chaperone DnaK (HSP70)